MRVSITDRCNLRCSYCMPEGINRIPEEEILTFEEITEICRQAAALGISKIKITGGEPLVRPGCAELIRMLKELPGIAQVTLTTNGTLLETYAGALYGAGVDAVNVSLDTCSETEYEEITGYDALADVMGGIAAMNALQIPVKINAVLCREREKSCLELAELARERPLDVRFIEMMPVGYGRNFAPVPNRELMEKLRERYGTLEPDKKTHGNGPAVYYRIPGFLGSIGFISAVHEKFCSRCSRIRLTCAGQLKPCLGFGTEIPVREAVRGGKPAEVKRLIAKAITEKPEGHAFADRQLVTENREMVKIGG